MNTMTGEGIDRLWHAVRSSADDLRAAGFRVAAHNDYRQDDKPRTFWLMTLYHDGQTIALDGRGETDEIALDSIRAQWARISDDHHHAPMCAANHYHGQRAPTGPCSCGAVAMG